MSENATKIHEHRPIDDGTAAALTLYNTYLVADREQQAHERALRKAEKAKDDAAASVRKLNDRKAPAAETSEAEARYREAVEALQRLRGGAAPAPDTDDDDDEKTEDDAASSGAEDAEDADDGTDSSDTSEVPATKAGHGGASAPADHERAAGGGEDAARRGSGTSDPSG